MVGFTALAAAPTPLPGIARIPMVRKGHLAGSCEAGCSAATQDDALALEEPHQQRGTCFIVPTPQYG